MNLVDDAELVEPFIFHQLGTEEPFNDTMKFNWDAEFAAASELPEPWYWEWKTPLRAAIQQIVGRPDVTAWTAEAGRSLAAILKEPTGMHETLLGFREAETGLLPAATDADTSEL